eukprot:CAMPEP_0198347104 /NCGR_PEP_ID=MMETSP1450-20131203/83068_1 /TAXON_ID=753684 ORGANISM="Madagascaria erythrocladiodes, Strain CCMP3234" /NCGR_SAMPLE_ID=MMETSP1450 /ASSEMBLY_ACC=CAM_ASM_001115 /LENGTH=47 /DNA_ID= /DNA_START= /DNA_END= /DNA_ORIENTATION=
MAASVVALCGEPHSSYSNTVHGASASLMVATTSTNGTCAHSTPNDAR